MKSRTKSLLTIALLLILLPVGMRGYNLRNFTNDDGLSNSSILSLYQDKKGFVWAGSCDGINVFSGLGIYPFNMPRNQILAGHLIEDMCEDKDGNIFVLTNYGLNIINKRKGVFNKYPLFKGYKKLRSDSQGHVFIITSGGLYYYQSSRKAISSVSLKLPYHSRILDYAFIGKKMCVFTENGIFSWRVSLENDYYHLSGGNQVSKVPLLYAFCGHEDNGAYCVDKGGNLFHYGQGHPQPINVKGLLAQRGDISDITMLGGTYVISFKTNGAVLVSKGDVQDLGIETGVFCMMKDRSEDIIWIGTDGQGVYQYSLSSYSIRNITYNNLGMETGKPIRAIFLDSENGLWLGTKGQGIIHIRNFNLNNINRNISKEVFFTGNSLLLDDNVYAFASSALPRIWIGSDKGINCYSLVAHRFIKVSVDCSIPYVHAIIEDGNKLWISTVGSGIFCATIEGTVDSPRLTHVMKYALSGGVMDANYFFAMAKSPKGGFFFGNRGSGFYTMKSGKLIHIPLKNTYHDDAIHDVFAICPSRNALWIGTAIGVLKIEGNTEKFFGAESGLINTTVHGILEDNGGNIWVTTNKGIACISRNSESIRTYDKRSGINVTEFSDGATFKKDRLLIFGGVNGIVAIHENRDYVNRNFSLEISLTGLTVQGEEAYLPDFITTEGERQRLTLAHDQNIFSITCAAPNYLDPAIFSYSYRISDSGPWMVNGQMGKITFTNMTPGHYDLQVRYQNLLTGKFGPTYHLDIYVLPPWYWSWWAEIIYGLLLVVMVIYMIWRWNSKQERRHKYEIERMRQSQKEKLYQDKFRFFTDIIHELNTPLTLIYGPCEKILGYNNTDAYIRKYIMLIKQNVGRLNSLVQEIIDYRRIETGHNHLNIIQADVSAICDNILSLFSEVIKENSINLEQNYSDGICWNTDKESYRRLVTNLVSNAFKYTPKGGTIRVSMAVSDNLLELKVYNTGQGISPSDRERIFDRYTILNGDEKSGIQGISSRHGLGMSICQSLTKLLGGTISVDSEVGKFAEFIVTLPVRRLTLNASELSSQNPTAPTGSVQATNNVTVKAGDNALQFPDARILIVEDNTDIREFLRDCLQECHTELAPDGETAIRLIKDNPPDLIITDIMMPGEVDGLDLTQRVKHNKHTMHIPLIILSAKSSTEEQVEGLDSGADAFIGKPFSVDYLKATVNRLLENIRNLKEFYSSSASSFVFTEGKLMERDDRELLDSIVAYIDENLEDENLTAESIASHFQMSARSLYRKLKDLGQPSPSDLIKRTRIICAARMLVTTSLTIQEIIYRSGFINRSHFYKEFAKEYGMTPKEYRSSHIHKDDTL